jgi:hypothetical protein
MSDFSSSLPPDISPNEEYGMRKAKRLGRKKAQNAQKGGRRTTNELRQDETLIPISLSTISSLHFCAF